MGENGISDAFRRPARRRVWQFVSVASVGIVVTAYVLTHRYPASIGGFYSLIAEEIVANGFRWPATIPLQSTDSIPFAYPPLGFYVLALPMALGASGTQIALYLPAALVLAAAVPTFRFVELFGDARTAGVGTVLVLTTPNVLWWHLNAGGTIRTLAFLFVLFGLYSGVRLFRDDDRRHAAVGALLFGATLLTHPLYAVFYGISFVWMWLYFGRDVGGLLDGSYVAAGGLLAASPWLYLVSEHHGLDVFFVASTTKGGLGPSLVSGAILTLTAPPRGELATLVYGIAVVGALYLLDRRSYFLLGWYAFVALTRPKRRFNTAIAAIVAAIAITKALPRIFSDRRLPAVRVSPALALTGLLLCYSVGAGTMYAAGYPGPLSELTTGDTDSYLSEDHIAAMEWLRQNTRADATVVGQGRVVEWLPYLAHRRLAISPWGAEWFGAETRRNVLRSQQRFSECETPNCVSTVLQRNGVTPDYLYLEKATVSEPLFRTSAYRPVYENEAVLIVET